MGETVPVTEEMANPILRFSEMISFFPEDEKQPANDYLAICQDYYQLIEENEDVRYVLLNYWKQNKDKVKNTKLAHLFIGSSLSRKDWLALKMDTDDNDWEKFIETEIKPLLPKEDKPEIEKKEAA